MKSKYNIGDKVFVMPHGRNVEHVKIEGITTTGRGITYSCPRVHDSIPEIWVFSSHRECVVGHMKHVVDSCVRNCNDRMEHCRRQLDELGKLLDD